MANLYNEFKKLLPFDPLMVGEVLSTDGNQVAVDIPVAVGIAFHGNLDALEMHD